MRVCGWNKVGVLSSPWDRMVGIASIVGSCPVDPGCRGRQGMAEVELLEWLKAVSGLRWNVFPLQGEPMDWLGLAHLL